MNPKPPDPRVSDESDPPPPELQDSVYHLQLARAARLKAASAKDLDVSIRLREAAVLHERKARQLKRIEANGDTGH